MTEEEILQKIEKLALDARWHSMDIDISVLELPPDDFDFLVKYHNFRPRFKPKDEYHNDYRFRMVENKRDATLPFLWYVEGYYEPTHVFLVKGK